jgi:hypothetical protein
MSESKVSSGTRKVPPARSPEELEKRCINLAEQQAEAMLESGKAPTQVLLHYLKLGTSKAELERAKLEHETKLLGAKTEALESAKKTEEIMQEVIAVFKGYGGNTFKEEDYEEC